MSDERYILKSLKKSELFALVSLSFLSIEIERLAWVIWIGFSGPPWQWQWSPRGLSGLNAPREEWPGSSVLFWVMSYGSFGGLMRRPTHWSCCRSVFARWTYVGLKRTFRIS